MEKKPQNKRSVISRKNLPAKLPVWQTAVLYLFYDRFPPQETWQWVIWSILILGCVFNWIVELVSLVTEKQVDIIGRINIVMKDIAFRNIDKMYEAMAKKHRNVQ